VRRLLSALILLTSTGIAVPAATAFAATSAGPPGPQRFGVRLLDVPLSEKDNPRGLRYIVDYLPPGQVIHRRILVKNEESQTARFTVYPDAAQIAGGFFTGDAGETRSELTSWITVQHPTLTVGPGQSATDMVTITEPLGATRGEHYGEIWVQQAAPARESGGVSVIERARVGIRIYLAVGPGGAPPPTNFAITSLTGLRSASGRPMIVAHVLDTGERAIDLSGQARPTDGPGGASRARTQSRRSSPSRPGRQGT
jgi:hypothetical protein